MLKKVMILFMILTFTTHSFAQTRPPGALSGAAPSSSGGPRRQLATIIFCGLGGAVLGLSTLSFYGRPQDHLSNIAVGFGLGVIIGTGYTLYQAASNPKKFYGDQDPSHFHNTYIRNAASQTEMESIRAESKNRIASSIVGYQFQF